MFENPRRGRQARNFTANVPKILDLKSSSEQIFSENCRWVPLFHSIRVGRSGCENMNNVPKTVDNYSLLWCYDVLTYIPVWPVFLWLPCQATLNLRLISLGYLLKGKTLLPGKSPKFDIKKRYGISSKSRRVAKWSGYPGGMSRALLFSAFCWQSEQGWFFLMRVYFLYFWLYCQKFL